jgi:hypothetical protein
MTKKTAVNQSEVSILTIALEALVKSLTVQLKAERLETARLRNLIKLSGGQPV